MKNLHIGAEDSVSCVRNLSDVLSMGCWHSSEASEAWNPGPGIHAHDHRWHGRPALASTLQAAGVTMMPSENTCSESDDMSSNSVIKIDKGIY